MKVGQVVLGMEQRGGVLVFARHEWRGVAVAVAVVGSRQKV